MNGRVATMLLSLAGVAFTNFALPTATAQAAVANTTIAVHVNFAGTSSWSSSGAFADEGWVMPLTQRFGSPLGPSPEWTAHEEILFVGRSGSFTIRQEVLLIDESALLSTGTAQWIVWSGTGAYAGLRGRGTASLELNWDAGTLDVELVGTFVFDDRTP